MAAFPRSPRTASAVAAALAVVILALAVALPATGPWAVLLSMLVALLIGLGPAAPRRALLAVALGVVGAVVLTLLGAREWHGWYDGFRELVFSLLWVGVPWLIGFSWQLRGKVRRQARDTVEQKRREKVAAQRRARDAERLSLAESLHDDLGHALSLVALNLGRLELDPQLGEEARGTVVTARRQLSEAVERLGASVSLLRQGAVPGLPRRTDVAEVLDHARDAGVEITVTGMPTPGHLARYDGAALTRLIQEALTNAAKHAPGQPVTIQFAETADGLAVTIANPRARGSGDGHAGAGSGLASLRAHVESLGGGLRVRADNRRFAVDAVLPPSPAEAGDNDGDTAGESGDEPDDEPAILARGRRRGRFILTAAAVIILAVLGTIETWTLYEARRALLPAGDFAHITPGDTRTGIADLLPGHELSPRPAAPPGQSCHDYAVTANSLDDASGDAYRICFLGDTVRSAEYVAAEDR